MPRVIIVHCWDGYPEYCWYPYAKRELEKRGFKVDVPAFPETSTPKQAAWVPALKECVGTPGDDLFLVGHSVGCITIMRYLETLNAGERVGGVVLIAGFTDPLGFKELENYFETPIDFEKIKAASKYGFIAIHSDDDPYVPLTFADVLKEKLGARTVVKRAMGHFSGPVDKEESCVELPDVVEAVAELARS